jgi:hypothetical protein
MAKVQNSLDRVALSGGEIKSLTEFPDEIIEDYLSIHDDINAMGDAIDKIASENTVPSTATSAGKEGQIAKDNNYIYVCIATNTWRRAAISVW